MEEEEVYGKRRGYGSDGEKKKRERGGVVSVPGGEEVKVKVANLVSCCISPSDSWLEEKKRG